LAVAAPHAHAAFIITLIQSGGNVVATGAGTINMAALAPGSLQNNSGFINPSFGVLGLGAAVAQPNDEQAFAGISGPSNFGAGTGVTASSGGGSFVELAVIGDAIDVPVIYASGTALAGTATWASATFASLGITPGTYTWTWGTGPNADSFTINAVSAAPEPGSLILFGAGGLGLAWLRRRRTA
jgi:hypothetical protein